MKVILQADVTHLGRAGEIFQVKEGFARNYLIPRRLALPVASQTAKEWNHKKKIADIRARKAQLARDEIAQKINGQKISIQKPSTPNGKLFGSVSAFEISSALKKQSFFVDKKFIQIENPIKSIGEYKIQINFGKDTQSEIDLLVMSQKQKTETTTETSSSEK